MGTNVEWSHVALFVATIAVGVACLELFIELAGVKNNPRESLVYLRHGVLLELVVRHDPSISRASVAWRAALVRDWSGARYRCLGDRKPAIYSPPKSFEVIASEIVAFGFTERGLFWPDLAPACQASPDRRSFYRPISRTTTPLFPRLVAAFRSDELPTRASDTAPRRNQTQALIANLGSYLQPALPNFNFTLSSALSFSCRRGSNRKVLPSKV
jgi:hypothetical protein